MAISLDTLDAAFRDKVADLLSSCMRDGVVMRPYYGLRHIDDQARLWRQSRSVEEIDAARVRLEQAGAPYLAEVLVRVGPQHGPHVTNALPGLSWHQWGEAVDCFWAINGQAEWSATRIVDGINGYRFYAERARSQGLTAGGLWPSFKDWPHVQLKAAGSPVSAGMSMAEIDHEMRHRFG